jgi:Ca2+-binding RTX toxin-like protein
LGTTLVTWTATSPSGKQTTATQLVTVVLGDDPACCPAGSNVIVGTEGADDLDGTAGSDCIIALGGDDQIDGFDGDDLISGGSGRDTIRGGAGDDQILSGAGDDIVDSGPGDDLIVGGPGVDTCAGGTGTNAISCEVAAHCTAACCSSNDCGTTPPGDDTTCGAAFSQADCLSYLQGSVVSVQGHNWRCDNGNCRNCATFASCAPAGSGCPWGVVWTDIGLCR